MRSLSFRTMNNLIGWFSFLIAFIVYSLTVEPTVSFWDCGEYISTSAKLQLGHPPGAPLYQMIGAFFAMFAPDASKVALMINMMSVISSALTILFMYWTLTIVLRKLVLKSNGSMTKSHEWMILTSALVGVLAFTFSDTFWFNAVEAEVYAMATFFISLLLWLGFRWEADMDKPHGNRWLLLISLIVGFSFGVHIMALLTIPAIVLIYYFKKSPELNVFNFIVYNAIGIGILFFVFGMLIPFTLEFFGRTEIFVVNTFGLPFNSGTIIAFLIFIATFVWAIRFTQKKNYVMANTLVLSVLFVLIGFSSWLMLPIRANANPPINENRPSDAVEMLSYYNREQYGSNSILFGRMYTEQFSGLDPDRPYFDAKPNYDRDYKTKRYVIVNSYKDAIQNLDDAHKGFLPRMWSPDHAQNYISYAGVPDFRIDTRYANEEGFDQLVQIVSEFRAAYQSGRLDEEDYVSFLKTYGNFLIVDRPSFSQNLGFLFQYQFNYMYWRYLMWNFAGRQSDNQGKGDLLEGNWLTGISFIDNKLLYPQENLPSDVLNNKGRNTYFLLPFLLGILGLVYQANRDAKNAYILGILFLFTGLALKIYLNERPFEPRERDYAVVGSFMVFAMWIGFGVFALMELISQKVNSKIAIVGVFSLSMLAAPILMASQNWDDHDRSGKYTALASAKAYLDSCDPHAILFTIGDNDTFPLWYAQEIEGYRTDVRIVNTQLLMTDWYIDQMKAQAYESEPLPISFENKDYRADRLDYIFYDERTENRWNLSDLLAFIKDDNPNTFLQLRNGERLKFFPTNKLRIPVNKEQVIKNKVVSEKFYDSIVPFIDINIKSSALYKNRLMMLDIIANNNWERPICFTGGSFSDEDYIWMKEYLQLDGNVYKLVPIKTPIPKNGSPMEIGMIDTEKMYNIVTNWYWGNSDGDIYHDPETRKNSITYRTNVYRLIEKLIEEEKLDKAKVLLDLIQEKQPLRKMGYYSLVEPYIGGYYQVGEPEKARALSDDLIQVYQEQLDYYSQLKVSYQNELALEIVSSIERYRAVLQNSKYFDEDYFEEKKKRFNTYVARFDRFGRKPE